MTKTIQNLKVGSGKTVHEGYRSVDNNGNPFYYTNCGADHATNRFVSVKVLTNQPVTCKRCLKSK